MNLVPVHRWGKGKEESSTRVMAIFYTHICPFVKYGLQRMLAWRIILLSSSVSAPMWGDSPGSFGFAVTAVSFWRIR